MNKYHILFTLLCNALLTIHKALAFILSPHLCLRCGEECIYILCPSCLSQFLNPSLELKRCSICGKQLLSEKCLCSNCTEEPLLMHTNGVYPIHTYRSWKKELLFQWKMCGNRTVSITAAQLFHKILQNRFPGVPIVPVPARPGKIFSKGWDQIHDVASILHAVYGYTVVDLLTRKGKKQQKKLSRDERIDQMGHLYELRKYNKPIPDEVVLIDDIMTTGVTLENCAQELKRAGVKKVFAVTLFIAD